jgi:type IV secretion system protein TrbL
MASALGTILPSSYFDGLSTLWGGCAYVASAIVATGLVFQAVRSRPDPASYIWLFAKVFMIGIATLFLREWLMRLNDIVIMFGSALGVDPKATDNRFVEFISGKTPSQPETSVWDVIWDTGSIGTAICYAFLWLFGWMSWGIQYVVKLIGGVLLTSGWALSPIFLSFFMIRPMAGVALKYVIGLIALVCWPFGWVIAAVVTNAMIDAAATASLLPVIVSGSSLVAPVLTVLLVGAWMLVSAILAPYVTTRILLMGANPATAFAQASGGVAQAVLAGGLGTATAAATGGATAAGVVAAAALGAMTSGAESAARGGGAARSTSTVTSGISGLYGARYASRQMSAMEETVRAQKRRAAAAEAFTDEFRRRANERRYQPHHPDPNQAAIEIEAYAKS